MNQASDPRCISCSLPTGCYTTDVDGVRHARCAECQVKRHEVGRYESTGSSADGVRRFVPSAGGWGLSSLLDFDEDRPLAPVFDIAARRKLPRETEP